MQQRDMPTSSRREDAIIELFVSAYEDCAWKDSHIDWLDRAQDGAVEALVTRPDRKTLAIEHTLIESFVGERDDLERSKKFQCIEDDPDLRQPDRIVYINVPRGALPKLAKTPADVRILLLERSQWSLSEAQIWQEIRCRAADFPLLGEIAEIWFAETVFYDVSIDPNWRDYLGFKRYAGDEARLMESMEFMRGVLIPSSRHEIVEVTPEN